MTWIPTSQEGLCNSSPYYWAIPIKRGLSPRAGVQFCILLHFRWPEGTNFLNSSLSSLSRTRSFRSPAQSFELMIQRELSRRMFSCRGVDASTGHVGHI
uniref:Uncharacterized protein n=1 Tax=Zea mays TaxID=4577 RepID=A0A804Q9U7_MAIZE